MNGNRVTVIALAISLSISGCNSGGEERQATATQASSNIAQQIKSTVERDSQVINAAMAAFFEDADWQSFEWQEGDTVVLAPEWDTDVRSSFYYEVQSTLENYGSDGTDEEWLAKLRSVVSEMEPPKDLELEVAEPLDRLILDENIVLKEYSTWRSTPGNKFLTDGVPGKVRVRGTVAAPTYSADGKYALLGMGASWSRHGAGIAFFLERNGQAWHVFHVESMFVL
ncbi:MAG: hypothetical protein IH944_14275 [Armatimonadetes bacterium]|nr:hypothetical protein [Armatimonadota bacterium]